MSVQYAKSDIGGFSPGQQFRINATMPGKGYFQVLLENDEGSEVFHFSVNIDPPNVSYTGNSSIRNWSHCWHLGRRREWDWVQDTIATGKEVPIKVNQKFTLTLRALKDGIEIVIDGKPIYKAEGWKETELKDIEQLKIMETIIVHSVDEENFGGKTIENPSVPARLEFSKFGLNRGFGPDKRIRIVGVPTAAKRFQFDLVEDPNSLYSDNMEAHNRHLHFTPRFDQKQVVRNNLIKGKGWQTPEERDGGFPFAVNKQFVVDIVGLPGNKLKVLVDGKDFCEFGPRGDLSTVDRLEIHGDAQIKAVSMGGGGGAMASMFGGDIGEMPMFSGDGAGMSQMIFSDSGMSMQYMS